MTVFAIALAYFALRILHPPAAAANASAHAPSASQDTAETVTGAGTGAAAGLAAKLRPLSILNPRIREEATREKERERDMLQSRPWVYDGGDAPAPAPASAEQDQGQDSYNPYRAGYHGTIHVSSGGYVPPEDRQPASHGHGPGPRYKRGGGHVQPVPKGLPALLDKVGLRRSQHARGGLPTVSTVPQVKSWSRRGGRLGGWATAQRLLVGVCVGAIVVCGLVHGEESA